MSAMVMKLKEVPNMLLRCYAAKVNVYLWGKPGIGKTETVMKFVEKMQDKVEGFKVWFFYGPSMGPTDIQAAMPDMDSKTLLVYNNAALPNAYTNPKAKGVCFFGEAANTDPTTFKLLQKYINGEDMNGVLRKPEGVMVIADGNRLQDKSGVQQQGRALMSRFQQIDVYTDANDNTEYAERNNWHPYIQAHFRDNPASIDNYEEVFEVKDTKRSAAEISAMSEEGKRGLWASMRGWERLHRLETACDDMGVDLTAQEIVGNVGSGPGRLYIATRAYMGKLQSVDAICADPDNAPVPDKLDEVYGQCLVLALKCTSKQLPAIFKYTKRLPLDIVAMLIRRMTIREQTQDGDDFKVIGTETFIKWMSNKQLSDLFAAK